MSVEFRVNVHQSFREGGGEKEERRSVQEGNLCLLFLVGASRSPSSTYTINSLSAQHFHVRAILRVHI